MKLKVDCVIGIDPGASGGLAVWRPNQNAYTVKMPKDLFDLKLFFMDLQKVCNPIAFIEKVQLQHNDVSDHPGKIFQIQKMLQAFQQLKDIATFCEVPFILVHPQKWQADLKLRVKGESKPDRKKRYQRAAGEAYPAIRATLWNSDAVLLMHFGRYKLQTAPDWVLENLPKIMHHKLLL